MMMWWWRWWQRRRWRSYERRVRTRPLWTIAMMVTTVVSMVTPVMMFMPAGTSTTFKAMGAIHGNIFIAFALRFAG
ncbi:hypothetical protein EDB86DRAFT_2887892 [Lactarius hatsudake]|nr:hypothetical protein EDB86DRAFT_2887892 [Lactarius hatsudake]